MKKRILSMLVACAMIFTMLPTVALAAETASGNCGDTATWSFDAETGALTISGTGAMIDNGILPWYDHKGQITSVVVGAGIISIGRFAFDGCTNLTSVTLPDSVTSIGNYAFQNCTSLTSVTLPDLVTSIGNYAFNGCISLTSVTIPDSVITIGNNAFNGCTSLTSVTLPDSVTKIERNTFDGCKSLTSVTMPSVTSIDSSAFQGCTGLTSVDMPSATSIGSSAFRGCSGLTSVDMPSVTSIGSSAFQGCSGLTSVTIPDSVMSIGTNAFRDCTGLTSVTIPDSVTSIGNSAFRGCTNLTSVTIPDSVTSIGIRAFQDCTGLTSVNIPASIIETVPDNAFQNCNSLTINSYNCIVWFNLNGHGNSAPDPQYILDKATEPTAPSEEGYTFGGWYKEADCADEDKWDFTYSVTADTTLYAKWSVTEYAVTYAPGANGTGTVTTDSKTHGTALTLADAIFTRAGYTQTGWATTDDGNQAYALGASYTDDAEITLYPVWTANTYTVTVTGGEGGGTYAEGFTVTIKANEPETGYQFTGWTVISGDVDLADESATETTFTMPDRDVSVKATYGHNTYTVTYAPGTNCTGTETTATKTHGTALTLEGAIFTRTGYTQTGWATTDGGEQAYALGASYTANEATTLYPVWTVDTYTVTYAPGANGTGTETTATKTHDTALTLEGAIFTRTGYTHTGWATTDGGEQAYTLGASYTANDATTLYPVWTADTYTVTLNSDGATINSNDVTSYTYGVGAELPTDVVKFGYDFGGWYDNAECTGTLVTAIGTAEFGDKDYYAKWTPAQLSGTVTITGTVQVGETLTATVSDSNNTGALSYKWYRHAEDSVLMGESANNVYVITEDAVAQKIYCVVSSDVQTGTLESEKTGVVPNLIFPVGAISAEGYTGTYDGQPHGITVTAPVGTTVYYGTDGENYGLNASPTYTDAGIYTVYYRVVKDNYDGVTGSAVVNIVKADPTVTAWPTVKGTVYVNDNAVVLNDDGTVTGVDSTALDGSFAVGDVDLTSAGQKTVTVTFTPADSTNYNTVEKTDYQVTVSNRPVYSDDFEPSYSVTVADCENGTIQLNRRYAERGQTVIVTVTPDKGYVLETLTVTDRYDREITLTAKEDGTYTFKMPSSKVSVEAIFVEIKAFENPFVDVTEGAYYYDAVLWAAENGITSGTSATTFSPAAVCTRAQNVTFLWRAAGAPEPKTVACPFDDVDPGAYYYKAVLWAAENGITGGTSATTFSPDATVTRAQTVTFLWRVAGSPATKQPASFGDVATDAYYHDAVVWAADKAITSGTSATTFSPADPCLRSQIVTFLYRYYVN